MHQNEVGRRSFAYWKRPLAVGSIVSTIGTIPVLTSWWTNVDYFPLIDFHNYESTARRLVDGGNLYAPWQSAPYVITHISPSAGFAYSPPAAILFVPFIGLSSVWLALNAAAWIGTLILVARRSLWVVELCLILSIVSGALLEALDYGQVTPIVAGSLGLAFWRPQLAGPIACVSGLTKMSPVLLALVDGWRGLLRGLVTGLVIVVVTLPLVGLDAWREYALALVNVRPECGSGVISASCTFGPQWGSLVGWAIAAALIVAGLSFPRYRALLFAVAIIVATPEIKPHYLLVPIMGLAVTLSKPTFRTAPIAPLISEPAVAGTGAVDRA